MKKNRAYYYIMLLVISWYIPITCSPVVTFFYRDYPTDEAQALHLSNKLSNPKSLAKKSLETLTHHNRIAGIFSTYYGYLQPSNINGQTRFPRKQGTDTLLIIVTPKITPVMMFQNTVSHWELEPGVEAAAYKAEYMHDAETNLDYWNVQPTSLPENNQIPSLDSLIIFAKPKNIYIPTGITLTKPGPNLVLPDMYVKRGICNVCNALYLVNLTPFFRPVTILYKQGKKELGSVVAE